MPEPRPQQITDPNYPDLIGIEGGPLIPCKVTALAVTTAPADLVEGVDGLNATYEQTRQYVIRYRQKHLAPRAHAYTVGPELWQDRDLQPAREPTGWVPTVPVGGEYTPEHKYVLNAYRETHGLPTVGMPAIPTASEVNQAVTWWRQRHTPRADAVLTSTDPEPPAGAVVETEGGERWWRDGGPGPCEWFPLSQLTNPDRHDPESWTKVAGNYGPVKVVSTP